MNPVDPSQGVYAISVAADLVGMGMQQLRSYESQGLLAPQRTNGGTRRYSQNDLTRLRRIDELLDAGLNLAGIAMVMDLQDELQDLRPGAGDGTDHTATRQDMSAQARSSRREEERR